MDVFRDITQALRFAFTLEQYPAEPGAAHGSMVRLALSEAGITLSREAVARHATSEYHEYAADLRTAVRSALLPYEASSLIAMYSRDWAERRRAAETLASFHARLLSGLIDDNQLIAKLVTRHYIAERERGSSWALHDIAAEFNVSRERITRAARHIESHARQLDTVALQAADRFMRTKELAHA